MDSEGNKHESMNFLQLSDNELLETELIDDFVYYRMKKKYLFECKAVIVNNKKIPPNKPYSDLLRYKR